jgi:predicted phosphodiesterase
MISKESWLIFILIIITTFTFVLLLGDMNFNIKGFEFRLSMEVFDSGLTEINIPPIGIISAKTHQTPLKITVTLINIDIDLLKELIEKPLEQGKLVETIIKEVQWVIFVFVARMLFIAALGGAFAILLLHKRDLFLYFKGSFISFSLMLVLILGSYYTYDVSQFSNPQYRGVIKAAPWMIGFVEEALVKVDKLGEQLKVTADNLYTLFEKIDILGPVGEYAETTKILHISDIHNNPAAFEFIKQVADSFEVDIIVDTGDISDFGSPLETILLERINNFSIPYVFVAGNHDSPDIINAMEQIDNVIVVNNEMVNIKEFNILGKHDPASVSMLLNSDEEEIINSKNQIEEILRVSEITPDILIVHHPYIAENFAGRIPVILHGHRHQVSLKNLEGSIIIDAGTSGAAGIRGLQSTNEIPYSVVLLHFASNKIDIDNADDADNVDEENVNTVNNADLDDLNEKKVLIAVDKITVFNLEGGFTIERIVFN